MVTPVSGSGLSGKTPHELFVAGEKLCLELHDHLNLAVLPRLTALAQDTSAVHEAESTAPQVPDSTIRSHADRVIESVDFARNLITRLEEMLSEASDRVHRATLNT